MKLEIQLQSLVMSFLFGMFFSLIFNIFYRRIFRIKKHLRLITTILFLLINTTLYFWLLVLVNDGIVHIYFLISILFGFLVGNRKTKKLRYKS
ncbi:MAG: spore cortex biosynthesis protein YabQ [Bacilli bacterium]